MEKTNSDCKHRVPEGYYVIDTEISVFECPDCGEVITTILDEQ